MALIEDEAVQFTVSSRGEYRSVSLKFGSHLDVRRILRWRTAHSDDGQVLDAMEFRKLATKRWKYYEQANEAALSIEQLREAIEKEPFAEVGFLLVAIASWGTANNVLGCCFCRRSWSHHLILDFLAVHPQVVADRESRGVGTGIVYSLVELADELGIKLIWGEATRNSAPFYEKILNLKAVADQFQVGSEAMDFCRSQLKRLQQSALQNGSEKEKF
jgi:N-acetylglutamate synthase-like GNAT family acetyltransferase